MEGSGLGCGRRFGDLPNLGTQIESLLKLFCFYLIILQIYDRELDRRSTGVAPTGGVAA